YGVRYNTTNNGYRECLANGSWAARVNYSECQEILNEEKKSKVHYHVAVIINYLGHCISLVALLVAFVLFLRLRSIRCLRNIIHWNLISAFILRNATWFVVQLTMSPEVHQSNVVCPSPSLWPGPLGSCTTTMRSAGLAKGLGCTPTTSTRAP
ncbi:corticotropin releasing hormone receptor 1, partial [Homo sapiens]